MLGYTARARDVTRASDLRRISQALEGYYATHDVYPPTSCGTDGYDCINIDSGSFITSNQTTWSNAPVGYNPSPSPLDSFTAFFTHAFTPENSYADIAIAPDFLQATLSQYLGNSTLPKDPINTGTFPWVDKKSYVYSYGNVGKLQGQIGYDLTATLENPNNAIACKNRFARYGYNDSPLCDPTNLGGDDVVNASFTGVHHSLLYEAGNRDGKFSVTLTGAALNYQWSA